MKIFIISGKAHNGKNTVGEIIKKYYQKYDKKVVITSYAKYLKMYASDIISWDGNEETKPRKFLQDLGCDIIKKDIDSNFLINRMLQDILIYKNFADILIITDARFKEEIEIIKNEYKDVYSIRVVKENPSNSNHISEVALDNYHDFDYVIDNSFSISELEENVIKIIKEVEVNE